MDGVVGGAGPALMRLPELIAALANEGEVLRWDPSQNWYEVIDGPRFEERYNALRCRRERRKEDAVYRPFARMHTYFTLLRGEKWAGTGSAFRPRSKSSDKDSNGISNDKKLAQSAGQSPPRMNMACLPRADIPVEPHPNEFPQTKLDADKISVTLRGVEGGNTPGLFRCSLQHFLDVTGAGELYNLSATGSSGAAGWLRPAAGRAIQSAYGSDSACSDWSTASHPSSSPEHSEKEGQHVCGGMMLQDDDIGRIVGGLWDESSLGDQAYFFPRRIGEEPCFNGAIVALVDGMLTCEAIAGGGNAMYMVVSDNNAKWKGEPLPTPEEEKLGHWCAFLGQVIVFAL